MSVLWDSTTNRNELLMRLQDELDERFADVLAISQRLGIHPESARRLVRQGRIPGAFKFGNKWLLERDKLEQFAATYDGRPGPSATLF